MLICREDYSLSCEIVADNMRTDNKYVSSMTFMYKIKIIEKKIPIKIIASFKTLKVYVNTANMIWEYLFKHLKNDIHTIFDVIWEESGIGPRMCICLGTTRIVLSNFQKLAYDLDFDIYKIETLDDDMGMKISMFCKNP